MAQLSANLGDINPTSRIIDPGPRQGGFLSGLAGLAGNLIDAEGKRSDNAWKMSERKDATDNKAAMNEAAAGIAEVKKGIELSTVTPLPEAIGFQTVAADIPKDVKDSVAQLDKTKTAVDQGRSSADMLQLGLEKLVGDLQAKYPEQTAAIYKYMEDRGYDHFLFRQANNAAALAKADDSANVEGRQFTIAAAHKAGLVLPGMTDDQIYNRGQQYLNTKTQAEIAKMNADAAAAAQAAGQANYNFLAARTKESQYSLTQAHIGVQAGVVTDWLGNKVIEAGDDPVRWEQLAKLQPDIDNYITTAKLHARGQLAAQGVDKSVIDASDETYEGYRKSIQDIYFGPSSRAAVTHRSYTQMQETLGLDAQKAMPVWSMMNRMLGSGAVAQIFSGDPNLGMSPELIGKLKTEMLHFDPTKPNEATTTIYKIGELIKGNASLANMPEGSITPDYVRGLNAAASGNAKRILDPEPDNPVEQSDFLNSYAQVALAAASIQPGFKDLKALDYAVGSIADVNNIAVLEHLAKDSSTSGKAREVIQVGRASSAQLLEVARGVSADVEYKNGRFVPKPVVDKTQGMTQVWGDEFGTGSMVQKPMIPPAVQKQADVMNGALNYLVRTTQFDENTAGKGSAREIRDHFALGVPLGKPQGKDGKGPAPKTFEQTVNEFKAQLDSGVIDTQTSQPNREYSQVDPIVSSAAAQHGVPVGLGRWLIGQEGTGRTRIDNNHDGKPDSSAYGYGQFITETAKRYGLIDSEGDHRGDASRAIPAAMNYLSDLAKNNGGDWIKALHQYGTLARSNFKSDEQYQAAVASARKALG